MEFFFRKTIQLDPGFWTRTSLIQFFYGIWVNLATLCIGLAFGLPAIQVPQLEDSKSKIQITGDEASWIASILTLFSPIGCMLSGFIMDKLGRKLMIVACHGPMFIGWLCTALARSSNQIVIGRAITGIGCGMAMGPPRIYTTEISLPNMRGVLGAFPTIALSIGITIQAGLSKCFAWYVLCYICCAFTFINLILFNLLPESPYYVLQVSTEEKAQVALAKFRGPNYDIESEMNQLIEFKSDNDIRKLTFYETVKALFTQASCKPFFLISAYIFFAQTSGITCVLNYSVEILSMANSSVDVLRGNFLLALTSLIVSAIMSVLLFKVGRKPLALTSAVGVSFISISLGIYISYYGDGEPSLIPQTCFMFYVAFFSLGYFTLPFLMASEMYPLQIRGTLGGLTVSFACLLMFGSSMLYPILRDNIGLAYMLDLFGVCSLCGAIFLFFFLPETKQLTLPEIEEYYNTRSPTLISQRLMLWIQQQKLASSSSKATVRSKSTVGSIHSRLDNTKTMKLSSDPLTGLGALETKKIILMRKQKSRQISDQNNSVDPSLSNISLSKESQISKESLYIKDTIKAKKSLIIIDSLKTADLQTIEKPNTSKETLRSKSSVNEVTKKITADNVKDSEIKGDEFQKANDSVKLDDLETTQKPVIIKETSPSKDSVKTKVSKKSSKGSVKDTEARGDKEHQR